MAAALLGCSMDAVIKEQEQLVDHAHLFLHFFYHTFRLLVTNCQTTHSNILVRGLGLGCGNVVVVLIKTAVDNMGTGNRE